MVTQKYATSYRVSAAKFIISNHKVDDAMAIEVMEFRLPKRRIYHLLNQSTCDN